MIKTQIKKYPILSDRYNFLLSSNKKLNSKLLKTKDYEKKFIILNTMDKNSRELVRINSIIDYLDRYHDKSTPETINKLIDKLLNDEKFYNKTFNIDRRKKVYDYEF